MPAATPLPPYKLNLLQALTDAKALSYGTFTLKSGRISPYFVNAGLLHTGVLLSALSDAFARTIIERASESSASADRITDFDILYGPAYKGIPICTATLLGLHNLAPQDYAHVSYSFNRKVVKTYGDGGSVVGAPLQGKRVLIVDDVATAGTAIRESVGMIEREGGKVVGIVVALDRMERAGDGEGEGLSTLQMLRRSLRVPVVSVICLDDIIEVLGAVGDQDQRRKVEEYRERYKPVQG